MTGLLGCTLKERSFHKIELIHCLSAMVTAALIAVLAFERNSIKHSIQTWISFTQ